MTKEIHASVPLDVGEVARWDQEADVIVAGLGMAGGAAAIEAARAGAEVLVLERAEEGGGTSAESEGMIYFGGDLDTMIPAVTSGEFKINEDPTRRVFHDIFKPIICAVNGFA